MDRYEEYMKLLAFFLFILMLGGCAHTQDRHTLKKGETLRRIAQRYQISPKKLADLNHVAEEDLVKLLPSESESPKTIAYLNLEPERGPLQLKYNFVNAVYVPASRFVWPVIGKLTSRFGQRWGKPHHGIDISVPFGTPIKAARSGVVIHSGMVSGYGKLAIVYHGKGYSTVYAHASELMVKKGMRVEKGEKIALAGSSGHSTAPHLHFEIRHYKSAKDPMRYLP